MRSSTNKKILSVLLVFAHLLPAYAMAADTTIQTDRIVLNKSDTNNKDLVFSTNNGATKPVIRANGAGTGLQFSNDGTNFSSLGSGGSGGSSGIEFLPNPGFENGAITNGWTASGGTAALVAAGATGFLFGTQSAKWTASASGQTFKSAAFALGGLAGGNCAASVYYTYAGTAGDYTLEAIDGSSNILAKIALPVQASAVNPTQITWPCNSSPTATITWQLVSNVASPSVIYFDTAHLGSNSNYGTVQQMSLVGQLIVTSCASQWASTATGSLSAFSAVSGCVYTASGSALAPATNIPGIRFASLQAGNYILKYEGAIGNGSGANGSSFFQFWDGTNTANEQSVIAQATASTTFFSSGIQQTITYASPQSNVTLSIRAYTTNASSASTIYGNSPQGVFSVYYVPSASQGISQAGSAAANWSGTTSLTGSLTSSSAGDFGTVSGSVAALPGAQNISCSAASSLVGITCTLPSVGQYQVCYAGGYMSGSVSTSNVSSALTDGSNNAVTGTTVTTMPAAGAVTAIGGCGNYNATSTTVTFKLRGSVSSGTENIYNPGFSILGLNTPVAAPVYQGSVTSNAPGGWRVEGAQIAPSGICSSSPCTIGYQSGSWLSSVTRASAGHYTMNFAAGEFSAAPACVFISQGYFLGPDVGTPSATSFNFFSESATGSTYQDTAVINIICMGPH